MFSELNIVAIIKKPLKITYNHCNLLLDLVLNFFKTFFKLKAIRFYLGICFYIDFLHIIKDLQFRPFQ